MKAKPLRLDIPVCELGEGPVWDSTSGLLYWVDIEGKRIYRYDSVAGFLETFTTPSMVGFAIPDSGGGMIAGLKDGLYAANHEFSTFRKFAAPNPMPEHNRFNDGKCDRRGRLWCGTMNLLPDSSPPTGALYRYRGRGLVRFEDQIYISNGIGWSPDNSTMYYTDTLRRVIWQYDYDIETGRPYNKRIFVRFGGHGSPDGLTVDIQGRVLTALWGGWAVEVYTPDGKLDGRIDLPVPQVTSCCFGGPDLKTLYITTARSGMSPHQLREAPLSGKIFAIDMDVSGLPEAKFCPDR
jgi:sugar lactone lactonase YvrE